MPPPAANIPITPEERNALLTCLAAIAEEEVPRAAHAGSPSDAARVAASTL